ncbi:SUMO-interacting motif-containing protein 1 isoform X2 [Rhinoderma darwinii]|uniref:SUMO-interacting motif-containing protein 1 isoform X2 n=1 Tax=Rhinoderma darwinii TaxID=43563 RepID=UPI003F673BC7
MYFSNAGVVFYEDFFSQQDIIDLTGNGDFCAHVTSSEDNVIDLTGHEEETLHGTFQQQMKSESKLNICNRTEDGWSDPKSEVIFNSLVNESCKSRDDKSTESCFRSTSSSICSAKGIMDAGHPDHLPRSRDADLPINHMKPPPVNSLHLQATYNKDPGRVLSEIGTQVEYITSSTSALMTAKPEDNEEETFSQSPLVNKSLLYKLRYFKKPPVSHLFPHTFRHDKNRQPVPMPLSRTNLVNNTKDESFHQGTLYFLSEFLSASHYPPKDLISHVINVLLGAEDQTIRLEAYMILMRIQRLHPATSESVAWDWKLLSEVMSKQEHQTSHLFLQYVVQTLDDDFHLCLQRRMLHKCLCKSMLSCDKSFYNVKQVIHWLIDAVKYLPENCQDSSSQCNRQRVVFLLQRMLSIAVEVDNSPTMNSNKMADYIFPYITVLKTRQQREIFFSSAENILLRAKILEAVFHHSCQMPPPPMLSLCFCKILYFISNSTLQLENQGPEWQRWDEMLHHIILLCLSLQTIITDHLRSPVIDRTDEILKRPRSQLYQSEDITLPEVDISLANFQHRMSPGTEPAAALLNRLFLLRSLLHTAVKR